MRNLARILAVTLPLVGGCAARSAEAPIAQAWLFEAQPAVGEVRVLPTLVLHEAPELTLQSFVDRNVGAEQRQIREARTRQLGEIPRALGQALPGAVNGQLGKRWSGQFRHGRWPAGAAKRMERALAAFPDTVTLDATLESLADQVGSGAVLVTWTRELDGEPVSMYGFPGDLVRTEAGDVVVDQAAETYLVGVEMGIALVTADEVLIRYEDRYHTLLSESSGSAGAAERMAGVMATEVAKVWATDTLLPVGPALVARQ